MADEETKQQVNAEMSKELVEMLDAMRETDEQTRSGFIRMLIRQEFQRRQGLLVQAKIISAATITKSAIKKPSAGKSMSKILSA